MEETLSFPLKDAINRVSTRIAEDNRLQCSKDFPFDKEWNGKIYAKKRVRPIFLEKEMEIVVITVYTYYF